MIFKIECDYMINNEKNIVASFTLEQKLIEIEIAKSVVSNYCFISIKEDGEYIIEGKVCTAKEYILHHGNKRHLTKLLGDFCFLYTTREDAVKDFDIDKLGKTLFLFYNDFEV